MTLALFWSSYLRKYKYKFVLGEYSFQLAYQSLFEAESQQVFRLRYNYLCRKRYYDITYNRACHLINMVSYVGNETNQNSRFDLTMTLTYLCSNGETCIFGDGFYDVDKIWLRKRIFDQS